MIKVKIEIPTDDLSTYGKTSNNSMVWKKVADIKHVFFGNNEFMSLLNGKSTITDPYTNTPMMTISTFNNEFQYVETENINPIENKSNISSFKEGAPQ